MRLSSQLMGSIVGITILAQVVFGSVAYMIISDSHVHNHNRLNQHIVNIIGARIQADNNAVLSGAYLEDLVKQFAQPDSALLVEYENGNFHISDSRLLASGIRQSIENSDDGRLVLDEHDYHWVASSIPDSKARLILLKKTDKSTHDSKKTLAIRLISSSFIVIWIAIWMALILSSIISKKLEQKNKQLRHQALHDKLTGLPNRTLLLDRLNQALTSSDRNNKPFALLVMDVDHFKEVNDTLGHNVGDQLLRKIADSIEQTLRKNDSLARLGGDEFAVLLPNTDTEGAMTCAAKILYQLERPLYISDTSIDCKVSIGIALYPKHGNDSRILLQHADVAMYNAKQSKNDYTVYDARLDPHSIKRLKLMSELREAVESEQVIPYYQPMINHKHGQTVAAEALARWKHPVSGFIPPDEFIPVAERTGIIKPLTLLIFKKAVNDCKQWHDEGYDINMAINISTYCLQDKHFTEKITEITEQSGLPARYIELEITESAIMHDLSHAKEILRKIHKAGFKLSIDDFGTGFSSLAYLKELPVDFLKIDKSFVFDMDNNNNSDAIVQAVIELAHNFNCKSIAEGVENQQTLEKLEKLGNDIAQGYYMSKPLPGDEFFQLLSKSRQFPSKRKRGATLFDAVIPAHRIK